MKPSKKTGTELTFACVKKCSLALLIAFAGAGDIQFAHGAEPVEFFDLEALVQPPSVDSFSVSTIIGINQPFFVAGSIGNRGAMKISIWGKLYPVKNGKYPLKLMYYYRCYHGATETNEYRELELELDKSDTSQSDTSPVSPFQRQFSITLRRHQDKWP